MSAFKLLTALAFVFVLSMADNENLPTGDLHWHVEEHLVHQHVQHRITPKIVLAGYPFLDMYH